jgi:enoyl-CoA hydratase/3-hydroxyacyl-CoA dehydrogenase
VIARAYIFNIFTADHHFKQVPGVTDMDLVPRRVNKVGIIGGGLMGSEIATALILGNYPVILREENDKLLQDGIGRVRGTVRLESYIKIIIASTLIETEFKLVLV